MPDEDSYESLFAVSAKLVARMWKMDPVKDRVLEMEDDVLQVNIAHVDMMAKRGAETTLQRMEAIEARFAMFAVNSPKSYLPAPPCQVMLYARLSQFKTYASRALFYQSWRTWTSHQRARFTHWCLIRLAKGQRMLSETQCNTLHIMLAAIHDWTVDDSLEGDES